MLPCKIVTSESFLLPEKHLFRKKSGIGHLIVREYPVSSNYLILSEFNYGFLLLISSPRINFNSQETIHLPFFATKIFTHLQPQ